MMDDITTQDIRTAAKVLRRIAQEFMSAEQSWPFWKRAFMSLPHRNFLSIAASLDRAVDYEEEMAVKENPSKGT